MKTPERVAEARRLRDEGMLWRDLAEHFGVGMSTVECWVRDPDGARLNARKDSYASPCVGCGGKTNGSRGRIGEQRCDACNHRHQHETATWTRERLITEAQRWRSLTGSWPTATHWHHSVGERTSVEYRRAVLEFRALTGPWPFEGSVGSVFGSWGAFMAACGGTAPGSCKGVRWGQRAEEMRAAITSLGFPQRAGESSGKTVPTGQGSTASARPAGGPLNTTEGNRS